MSLITRRQIADKYSVDLTTLTRLFQQENINAVQRENRYAQYDEEEVVKALRAMYMKKSAGFRKAARMWGNRADHILDIYEEGNQISMEEMLMEGNG